MRTLAMVLFGGLLLSGAACSSSDGAGATAPAAPTGLAVAKLGAGGHLTWTDASDNEDEFMIMRKEGGGAYIELSTLAFNQTQYHDEPLTTGTTYVYMVMALNDGGQSSSNEVSYVHQ